MNEKKAFPIAVVILAILIIAIVLVVLYQDGTIKLGSGSTTVANQAVIHLVPEGEAIKEVPIDDFEAFIESADRPVFVDFWAEWCPPCREASPFVKQLALDYDGEAHIVKVNVDLAMALATRYKAQSIPQFTVFVDGSAVESVAGYAEAMQDDLRALIDRQLS